MVDNRYSLYKGLSDRCVESLMPKGVEHGFGGSDTEAWGRVLNL